MYKRQHDNDTTVGWWNHSASEQEKAGALDYFGRMENGVHWAFIRGAFGSVATLAIVPVQDVLGLDSDARMNVPSKPGGNWSWRLAPGALTREIALQLARLTELTDREVVVKDRPQTSEAGFAA